jgi:hypothetical protein
VRRAPGGRGRGRGLSAWALGAASLALASLLAAGGALAEEPAASPSLASPRSLVGAASPDAGHIYLAGEAGMIFILPHLTAGGIIGLGGGAAVELRYRNIAALGHNGRLRLAWGTKITDRLLYGISARTSITSLRLADAGLIGIQFSNLAIGNDWEVGSDISLTWLRPGDAHITVSLGPTWTLGGPRYTSFKEDEFLIEPGIRSIMGSVQGEWEMSQRLTFFLRLDAAVLLGAEIRPIGFIPTGAIGFGWSVQKP